LVADAEPLPLCTWFKGIIALVPMVQDDGFHPDDAEIVRHVVAGDSNAFEGLVKKYGNFILAIVKKHVPIDQIEDTAQDVFLRVYRSLPTYKGDNGFKHWLSVVAVRTCHDFWRTHYRSREIPISSFSEHHQAWLEAALSETSTELFRQKGLQREAREILDGVLARLSAGDRMVVELVYLEGHSVKEAAKLLGWTATNVKVRLFRSRRKLHDLLTAKTTDRRGDP
jgi:RNA polymerase sigma-70 factor (ECF subfamily)